MNLIIGNLISLAAAVFLAVSCIVKDHKKVFLWQTVNCLLLAVSSYFFGSFAGITTLFLCALRNILIVTDRYTKPAMLVTLVSVIASGLIANNKGIIGLLPIVATVEYTICCHYVHGKNATRWSIFANEVIWVLYSLLILDVSTAVSDLVIIVVDIVAIVKDRNQLPVENH